MVVPDGPAGINNIKPVGEIKPPGKGNDISSKGDDFARIMDEIKALGENTEDNRAGLNTSPEALDPAELVRRIDEAEKTFAKAMEIRRNLENVWQQSRNPYAGK